MSISQAFDAVCVYQGGSDYALNKLRSDPIPHSNNDPDIIYQDEVRAAAGNYITSLFTQAMKEEPWVDSATNVSLRFENILILFAKRTAAPGSTEGNVIHELVGSDIGYYACGAIRWHRENESDPFAFSLEDGTPLNLIPGKTYMGFVPTDSPIVSE